jgi:hypothetical protein
MKGHKMPALNIDNKEYELDTLSDECKAQLVSIQFVEKDLARIQTKAPALQTARIAYFKALNDFLTPELGRKFSFN